MDLTTNSIVITDAIKYVQNKMSHVNTSKEEQDDKESNEPDYNEDKEQLEEEHEKETGEISESEAKTTTNQVF